VRNNRGGSHRWLVPSVLIALTIAAVALAASQAGTSGSGRAAGASPGSTAWTADSGGTAATSTVSTALTAATSTTVAPSGSTADPTAAAEVAASRSGVVEWAIVDLATGEASGSGSPADPQGAIDAASMGKVLIAVAAVQQGLTASPVQAAELALMIEQSDNIATDGRWRLHCSAIVGSTEPSDADQGVAIVVMTHYSQELGMGYGEETCRLVAAALLPDALLA
jgi:hypothetical protein